jgi:hypothetical protein
MPSADPDEGVLRAGWHVVDDVRESAPVDASDRLLR